MEQGVYFQLNSNNFGKKVLMSIKFLGGVQKKQFMVKFYFVNLEPDVIKKPLN